MRKVSVFIDSNIFLYHLLNDHPEHSLRSTAFFRRIESGEVSAITSDIVIFEVVFTLQRRHHLPRGEIRDVLMRLIKLPDLKLLRKKRLKEAFDLYVDTNLSFADSYHVILLKYKKQKVIVSFDRGFDKIPGIKRIEPQ